VESEPYLVRISAAKRMRENAERAARVALEERVSAARIATLLPRRQKELA
jgi:chlorophyllide a reductase subunit Z